MLTDLYLIRHGEPARKADVPYQTLPGPDLSPRGREEARQAASFLATMGLEHLFVSPFARTTQTAEVLVEYLNIPVTFTGLVQEHGPHEPFEQVRERLRELLAATQDSPYQRIGLVTHGSPIRALLLEMSSEKIDLSKHVYAGGNPAPTCGIWHIHRVDEHTQRFELIFRPS
ncbi:histidine phosphatase family protein [Candidatus Chloroploca sp. M-50]|uniref:Histidine phosphatase family protein n=1 Tax=Candidatus Chloroploca mongolica TaxID=2528176 RepID=A0ABS4D815_9CHLR|nr:histidine phosphatase family protein [Candidatus Chloroploca mongolica]